MKTWLKHCRTWCLIRLYPVCHSSSNFLYKRTNSKINFRRNLLRSIKLAHLSKHMTKPTKWNDSSVKSKISLGIHLVWSESLLCTQWVAKDPSFLHADSQYSDHTGQMLRLTWIFAWHTCHFVGFVMRWLIYIIWTLLAQLFGPVYQK